MTEMAHDVSCCALRQFETALPLYFIGVPNFGGKMAGFRWPAKE